LSFQQHRQNSQVPPPDKEQQHLIDVEFIAITQCNQRHLEVALTIIINKFSNH